MFRATPMPAAGLSVLAGDLRAGDHIILEDFGDEFVVAGVDQSGDHVLITVTGADGRVETLRYHRLIPVDLVRTVAPEPYWTRVLLRGAPWWAVALTVGVACWAVRAPITGGAFLVIVVCWLFGCLAMVTTPERVR